MSSDLAGKLIDRGFYLGGSRRMAEKYPEFVFVTEKTDYDFNVQHSDDVQDYLDELGFVKDERDDFGYKDNQAMEFWSKGNVTVITRKDVDIYKKAFESVTCDEYIRQHWKSSDYLDDKFDKLKTMDFFNKKFKEYE